MISVETLRKYARNKKYSIPVAVGLVLVLLILTRALPDLYLYVGQTHVHHLNYGIFLNQVIDFIIVAFVIFFIIKQMNRLKKQPAPADPTTKKCPECLSEIPIAARRCAHCTQAVA